MPYELAPRDCAVIDHFSEIFFALAKLEYSFDLPYCKNMKQLVMMSLLRNLKVK